MVCVMASTNKLGTEEWLNEQLLILPIFTIYNKNIYIYLYVTIKEQLCFRIDKGVTKWTTVHVNLPHGHLKSYRGWRRSSFSPCWFMLPLFCTGESSKFMQLPLQPALAQVRSQYRSAPTVRILQWIYRRFYMWMYPYSRDPGIVFFKSLI